MDQQLTTLAARLRGRLLRRPRRPHTAVPDQPPSSSSSLERVGETWERLAQLDPLWAVLSDADKLGWRWDVQEFLQTGEDEIAALIDELRSLGFNAAGRGAATSGAVSDV